MTIEEIWNRIEELNSLRFIKLWQNEPIRNEEELELCKLHQLLEDFDEQPPCSNRDPGD